MIADQYRDLLAWETRSIAHVATIGPDGEPHSSPVWFDWDGEYVRIGQLVERQKYKNLSRDPRVSLSIEEPGNPYRYVEIRGVVDEVTPDEDNAFVNRLSKKYTGQDEFSGSQPGDVRMVVRIRPLKSSGMG